MPDPKMTIAVEMSEELSAALQAVSQRLAALEAIGAPIEGELITLTESTAESAPSALPLLALAGGVFAAAATSRRRISRRSLLGFGLFRSRQ